MSPRWPGFRFTNEIVLVCISTHRLILVAEYNWALDAGLTGHLKLELDAGRCRTVNAEGLTLSTGR